jgi:hypothetical protein
LIELDTDITLEFFEAQFNEYANHPKLVCKLVFVLKSIQDYHLRAEYALNSMDAGTWTSIQGRYPRSTGRETDSSICTQELRPDGRQFNGESIGDAEYASDDDQLLQNNADFQVESALGAVITNWIHFYLHDYMSSATENGVTPGILNQLYGNQGSSSTVDRHVPGNLEQLYSPEFQAESKLVNSLSYWTSGDIVRRLDFEPFKSYKIMKVFILAHAMSLGSRGSRSRNGWRFVAAKSMAGLDPNRVIVCEAIILSIFQRRQNAIRVSGVDNSLARDSLNWLLPITEWDRSIISNDPPRRHRSTPPDSLRLRGPLTRRFIRYLTDIFDAGRYRGVFRFPSARSLYNIVSFNFKLFVNDAVSYVIHLQDRQSSYANSIKWFIAWIQAQVHQVFNDGDVERLIESQTWESTWWIDQPGSPV